AVRVARAGREVEQARRAPDVERFGEIGAEVVAAGGQALEGLEVPVASVARHEAQRSLRRGVLPHVSAHRSTSLVASLEMSARERAPEQGRRSAVTPRERVPSPGLATPTGTRAGSGS